jgi:hypothetical protein
VNQNDFKSSYRQFGRFEEWFVCPTTWKDIC